MKGPLDDAIERQEPAAAEPQEAMRAAPAPRPYGGKALTRLLQVLESSGYYETAGLVVEYAVPDEAREEYDARAALLTAAPSREAPAPPRRGEGEGRGQRAGAARRRPEAPETLVSAEIADAYLRAGQQMGPPTATGPQWRSLGPWTIPGGQTYGASRVNVSGRVSAVAVDPSNAAHVLIGAANGGVWESRDRGASWAPRTDYAATLAVGAITFDRSRPSIVYCGLGEGDWWSWLGTGILRSVDGGTTWSSLCTTPFVRQGFYNLIVDPADGRHLLGATTGGLYLSTDGGTTWTRKRTSRTWSLSMAPAGGSGAEILAGSADGVFRSTDGGATWSAVSLPGSPGAFNRLAVAISPSNPATAYAWGARGSTAYLWRRAGQGWTSVPIPPGVNTGQAWYDWFLAVAPDRDTQIYCGAIEAHRGEVAGTTWTWANLTNKGSAGQSIHPDQHAIAFETGNPNAVYIGCDGGLFRSPDRGITWQHCNNGLVISEFEYLAQDVGSSRWLLGGTQDNGTERWTGSAIWGHVADGDGGDCGVNRTDPRTVFHTYYGMSPERSASRGDAGTWTYIPPPVPSGEGSLFYPPFECTATTGTTIAIGGDAIYVSRNNGAAWTRLAYPASARSSAMFIPDADNVFVGTTDGRIFRSRWNGTAWTGLSQLTTPRSNASVSDLYVGASLTRIWATYSTIGGGRVFRSDDAGATWADRTAGLPDLPINAIDVDSWNPNRAWAAADLGVYQTFDGGASWAGFSNGLPNAYVGDLVFHPWARVLRAGTRNRGVWEIPVDGWMTRPQCGVQWTGTLAGNETKRWFTFRWPATWHVVWTVMPTTPRPGAPQVTWHTQAERANAEFVTYWITVQNLTPDTLQFEGRYCILSRY